MCLADFIDPQGDWIGGFAVSIHGIEPHLARFKNAIDDYSDILLKALADRLAEAFAERLHHYVRTALWGYVTVRTPVDSDGVVFRQRGGMRTRPALAGGKARGMRYRPVVLRRPASVWTGSG